MVEGRGGRLLVVYDHSPVCGSVCRALGAAGHVVFTAAPEAALEPVIETVDPDVIVGRLSGSETQAPHPPRTNGRTIPMILIVDADVPPTERIKARRAGADALFTEPFDLEELVARIDVLTQGRRARDVRVIDDLTIDEDRHLVQRGSADVQLTATEYRLLVCLATHGGRVLSKQQLLDQVWGFDQYDANVVEVHISALRRKLGASGARLIKTVRGFGYVMRPEVTASPSVLAAPGPPTP